jgi:uncharacterized protein HemX
LILSNHRSKEIIMKSLLALVIALTLGAAGVASAGMAGQGSTPKAKGEAAEAGKEKQAPTGAAEHRGGAAKEKSALKAKGKKMHKKHKKHEY